MTKEGNENYLTESVSAEFGCTVGRGSRNSFWMEDHVPTNMKSFWTIFWSPLYSDLFLQKQGAIPSLPPPGSVTDSVAIFVTAFPTDLSWQVLIEGYLTPLLLNFGLLDTVTI